MRITDTRLPKFEVPVISKMRCEMKKEDSAINEYEAVMEMADYLSRDSDF